MEDTAMKAAENGEEDLKVYKRARLLHIFSELLEGKNISKAEQACRYQVSERTIQRDIDEIRAFFAEKRVMDGDNRTIFYDRSRKIFCLSRQ